MDGILRFGTSPFNGQCANHSDSTALTSSISLAISDYKRAGGAQGNAFYIDVEVSADDEYVTGISFTEKDPSWVCIYDSGADDDQVASLFNEENPAEIKRIAELLLAYDYVRTA